MSTRPDVYDPPPKGLVEGSIRAIEESIALKIAVTDAKTAATTADRANLEAVLADLDRDIFAETVDAHGLPACLGGAS
ncbi:hypothetical protein ATK17_0008 [Branchiibius hedensis]|uniref:Uncharacterized protein n=1 Tax=Branchiibius hedensis TaxID=672460 RepID=A0A2Y8ZLA2_9MICO|nr:hypothetical protein [Branchiibius hedensis]PWJ22810.1 hypothetical protein ATK17_3980 [Branchiibius hedensis]PWJ23927.1 hypothetical protein ATK17_0008 [Branchiibius hedensis]SSA32745.1 hypothetical protein SAMN04489750_0008 [Branchiibius hedensis]SSA59159.1 hypothetical protein SAMN04489750_3980 [Branchiibius hedensis]